MTWIPEIPYWSESTTNDPFVLKLTSGEDKLRFAVKRLEAEILALEARIATLEAQAVPTSPPWRLVDAAGE